MLACPGAAAMMDFRGPSMIDFTNRKGPPPSFSLDKKDQARRSHMRRREWRAVLMLPLAIAVLAFFIDFLVKMGNDLGAVGANEPFTGELPLPAMPQPTLDGAKPLPSQVELDAAHARAQALLVNPQQLQQNLGSLDAVSIDWARAQFARDATDPPVPQRLMARDLVLKEARPATPALIGGQLIESVEAQIPGGDSSMQRLLIALDENQFAEVIAETDAKSVPVGNAVQVVGRVLGYDQLPGPNGTSVTVPLIASRVARVDESGAGAKELGVDREWSGMVGAMPSDLFTDVNDELALVETRPYYYLLGQVRNDLTTPGVYDTVVDLNERGNEVHGDGKIGGPDKFRDSPVTVRGIVHKAWEDPQVAEDKPFGVDRVQRILFYRSDFGEITENGVVKKKIVQRLFEAAVSGSQPLPKPGDAISVTGRFLKFHAIPVKLNVERDIAHGVQRQSDKVYTYFVVANGYRLIPPPPMYSFTGFEIAIISVVIVTLLVFWRLSRKEKVAAASVQEKIRGLRRRRVELVEKPKTAAAPSASAAPPAGSPSEGPPGPPSP
jgi:hypothetical protein